jgi:hypothetical protein
MRRYLSMSKSASLCAPAPPSDPPAADPAVDRLAASVARAESRLRALEEIREIGMRLMRKLEDAPAGKSDEPRTHPAVAFAKLSRALRLTIDLEVRAEQGLCAALAGEVSAHEARRAIRERLVAEAEELAGAADEKARQDAVSRVEHQVVIAIGREAETEKEYFERFAALHERLDWDEANEDVRDQPFREVVERLCQDIGLAPDWSDWTGDGWPEPPERGPEARPRWSPFHQVTPKPILKKNQNYLRQIYELAKPPP